MRAHIIRCDHNIPESVNLRHPAQGYKCRRYPFLDEARARDETPRPEAVPLIDGYLHGPLVLEVYRPLLFANRRKRRRVLLFFRQGEALVLPGSPDAEVDELYAFLGLIVRNRPSYGGREKP